jgi:hypothetical protein
VFLQLSGFPVKSNSILGGSWSKTTAQTLEIPSNISNKIKLMYLMMIFLKKKEEKKTKVKAKFELNKA